MRFGIVVTWANVQQFGIAISNIYLGSRIMRLTMLENDKNNQSWTFVGDILVSFISFSPLYQNMGAHIILPALLNISYGFMVSFIKLYD